jgi:hypothetical protein
MKFTISQTTLNKSQTVATILSLIAVPVVIAIIGSKIQATISNESLKKDYVQMAIRILAEESKGPDDADLRKWAIDILGKNSPVPFNRALKEQLIEGQPWVGAALTTFKSPENIKKYHIFVPPESLMEPSKPLLEPNAKNIEENLKRHEETAKKLSDLQAWVRQKHEDHDLAWDKFISNRKQLEKQ